jgi:hypothetical protein
VLQTVQRLQRLQAGVARTAGHATAATKKLQSTDTQVGGRGHVAFVAMRTCARGKGGTARSAESFLCPARTFGSSNAPRRDPLSLLRMTRATGAPDEFLLSTTQPADTSCAAAAAASCAAGSSDISKKRRVWVWSGFGAVRRPAIIWMEDDEAPFAGVTSTAGRGSAAVVAKRSPVRFMPFSHLLCQLWVAVAGLCLAAPMTWSWALSILRAAGTSRQ